MKPIKVDPAALAAELAWLTKSTGRSVTPALSAVRVNAVVGALQLRRTDYTLFRETSVPAEGGGQASILIDPVKLRDVLKRAQGFALVEITKTGLSIEVDGRSVTLKAAADLDDYPAWPVFVPGGAGAAIVTGDQLARALTSVGTDDSLPMLTGVRFEDGNMLSTDRFRLTRVAYTTHGVPLQTLVPGEALAPFTRAAELVTIDGGTLGGDGVADGMVHIATEQRSIIARTLDHEFPKWRHLIPNEDDLKVIAVLRRNDLLDAIETPGDVTLTVDNSTTMRVTCTDRDTEVSQRVDYSLIRADVDDLPFTVRLNRKNLGGCLKGIGSGAVRLSATKSDKPVLLQGVGDGELHLIMPIRMPG